MSATVAEPKPASAWGGFKPGLTVLAILVLLGGIQPFIGRWHPNYWQYNFEFAVWPMMLGFCCEYMRGKVSRLAEGIVGPLLWSTVGICGAIGALMLFGYE